jgi:hypothetical protein
MVLQPVNSKILVARQLEASVAARVKSSLTLRADRLPKYISRGPIGAGYRHSRKLVKADDLAAIRQ